MRALLAVVAAALLITGCGIPVEDAPRPLPTGTAAPTSSPQDTQTQAPVLQDVVLWFVREGALVATQRQAVGPVTSQGYLDLLVAGPTAKEQAAGIRSAVVSVVTGEPLVVTAEAAKVDAPAIPDDEVAIVLEAEFTDLLAAEQVLVLGEVVVTVSVGRVEKVLFVDEDGQQLGVPTADGRLANGPVGPEDYASLVG